MGRWNIETKRRVADLLAGRNVGSRAGARAVLADAAVAERGDGDGDSATREVA